MERISQVNKAQKQATQYDCTSIFKTACMSGKDHQSDYQMKGWWGKPNAKPILLITTG